eukprot:TRINITY_DN90097_c0_g1_i1.p1 TRINITY_DN90097_c0_g1~~TRINITY_DN90097_c0_g1_i1.p1  ORF type:complete len:692 (-),score=138.28 TRINITY_DN90097_c0_g1_i1:184-2205(-)
MRQGVAVAAFVLQTSSGGSAKWAPPNVAQAWARGGQTGIVPSAPLQLQPCSAMCGAAAAASNVPKWHSVPQSAHPGAGAQVRVASPGPATGACRPAAPGPALASVPQAATFKPSAFVAGSWNATPAQQTSSCAAPAGRVPAQQSPAAAMIVQPRTMASGGALPAAAALTSVPSGPLHCVSSSAAAAAAATHAAGDDGPPKPSLLSARSGASSVTLPERSPRPPSSGLGTNSDLPAVAGVADTAPSAEEDGPAAPARASKLAASDDNTVGALRAEIGGLRAELDSLRGLLDEGLSQREEAERSRSNMATRYEQLARKRQQTEQQLREAHAETNWLRSELVKCQRAMNDMPEEEDFDSWNGEQHPDQFHSSASWSPPKQLGERSPSSPPRTRGTANAGATNASQSLESQHPSGMQRSSSSRAASTFQPHHPSATGTDEVDEIWRTVLQRFPQHPHWCLVKEKRCVYRMGSQSGKKILCRVTNGGLQVRVGGGWMPALPFLERYGPTCMGPKPGEDPHFSQAGASVDLPPSMERLLVPTKAWAQKIGISKTPDLREQRRMPKDSHQARSDEHEGCFEEQQRHPSSSRLHGGSSSRNHSSKRSVPGEYSSATAPPDMLGHMAAQAAAAAAADASRGDHGNGASTLSGDRLQSLLPLPWPGPSSSAAPLRQVAESGKL